MSQLFRIAVYPGDGIGPEVIDETLRVLDAVAAAEGSFRLEYTRLPWGADYYHAHGQLVPDDFLDVLRPFDAILLGAVGWPATIPDHLTLAPLVRIRQAFDQYACVRPARLYPGLRSYLADKGSEHIDMVVIRENSEGEYIDNGGRFRRGTPDEFAVQTALHTRKGIERILRYGFELARKRRRKLTMATKSNAQRYAYVLWDEVLERTGASIRGCRIGAAALRRGPHEYGALARAVRCDCRFKPVWRLVDRPGRAARRRPGFGAQLQRQP
jgi:tartrate dehydrogenase/decarboxylase/D-malate dehydrogenase